jgi:hypothetical protein
MVRFMFPSSWIDIDRQQGSAELISMPCRLPGNQEFLQIRQMLPRRVPWSY